MKILLKRSTALAGLLLVLCCHACSDESKHGRVKVLASSSGTIDVELTNGEKIGFTVVPSDTVQGGNSLEAEPSDYYIQTFELTNGQFEAFIDAGGYSNTKWWPKGDPGKLANANGPFNWEKVKNTNNHKNLPVTGITFPEAHAYAAWLSSASHRVFRVPNAWEWEHAGDPLAKEGQPPSLLLPWGDKGVMNIVDPADLLACNSGYSDETPRRKATLVSGGKYPEDRSWCGIVDMAGNVQEWVLQGGTPALKGGCISFGGSYRRSPESWSTIGPVFTLGYTTEANPEFNRYQAGIRLLLEPE